MHDTVMISHDMYDTVSQIVTQCVEKNYWISQTMPQKWYDGVRYLMESYAPRFIYLARVYQRSLTYALFIIVRTGVLALE